MRQLSESRFPPPQRGVDVGWLLVCVLVPPAGLMLLAVFYGLTLFRIFASADEAAARSDRLAFGREVKAIRIGMTRAQLYGLGFFNFT